MSGLISMVGLGRSGLLKTYPRFRKSLSHCPLIDHFRWRACLKNTEVWLQLTHVTHDLKTPHFIVRMAGLICLSKLLYPRPAQKILNLLTTVALMTVKYIVNFTVTFCRTIMKVLSQRRGSNRCIIRSFGSFWVCLSENSCFEGILKCIFTYLLMAVSIVKIIEISVGARTAVKCSETIKKALSCDSEW